ncbi:MAG TPA: ABC transporter permease, partial [Pyrinomonadaceae bacterium]
MGTLGRDVRYAVRMMWKRPGFTLVAVMALALGIGANTTIFSLVNALLLRPLGGVEDPSRLVAVFTSDFSSGLYGGSSYPDYLDLRDQCESFAGLAAFDDSVANLNADDEAERLRGQSVTGNYFNVLGVGAAAGRLLTPADDEASAAERVVVISHDLWRRRFGSDAALVGRSVLLDGHPHTVVGVAAKEFRGTRLGSTGPAFWAPFNQPDVAARSRGSRGIGIVGRLKVGATLEQAEAEVATLAARLAQSYPKTNLGTLARPEEPRPMSVAQEGRIGPGQQRAVWTASALLLAVVGFVLLIACANVANMMLARASSRRREIAIRLALGAGRLRIMQQLLTESVLLALVGGVAGLLIALWTADLLPTFFPSEDAAALDFSLDWRVLGFAAAVSLVSGVLFGLAPALQATRPDVVVALKDDAGAGGAGPRTVNLRNALVVAQVALSLVLLIGAGLFLRSLRNAASADPGFDASGVLIARLELRGDEAKAERGQLFYRELQERVSSLAGVRSVGLTRIVPLSGG